jgi:hypothetical protein
MRVWCTQPCAMQSGGLGGGGGVGGRVLLQVGCVGPGAGLGRVGWGSWQSITVGGVGHGVGRGSVQ